MTSHRSLAFSPARSDSRQSGSAVKVSLLFLLYLVQLVGIALLLRALNVTGFDRVLGLPQLVAYWRGQEPPPEVAAQGPPLQALKHPEKLGPFSRMRHPENAGGMLAFWAFPRMTVNRLALALWTTLYCVVGSWHEDSRLQGAYGAAFDRYRRATPMRVPRFGSPPSQNR